ncbi:hypothetical protein R6Q59_017199 [Mikania micrantha]
MTSLARIEEHVLELTKKVEELKNKVFTESISENTLNIVAAKIIKDISDKIDENKDINPFKEKLIEKPLTDSIRGGVMEEIKALRLKEKILLIELKAIQEKIALYDESLRTTANSEQESERKKSESIPCQTAKGKEKSSPLTPVAMEKSKNKVNEELQSSSSPVANGSSKDTSNPLIADSLLKTDKPSKKPRDIQQSLERNTFKAVKSKEEIEEEKDFISLDEFRIVWSKARALSQDEFETKHLYTEDKATKSLIICCPGSSPEMKTTPESWTLPMGSLIEEYVMNDEYFSTQKEIGQRRRKKKGAKGNHRTSEGGRPKVNRECRNFRSLEGRLGSWETGNRKRRRLEEGPIGYCGLRLQYSDFRPDIPAILELQIGGLLGWCPTSAFLVLTDSLSGSGSQGCLKYAPGSTQTHEFRDVSS